MRPLVQVTLELGWIEASTFSLKTPYGGGLQSTSCATQVVVLSGPSVLIVSSIKHARDMLASRR